MSSTTRPKSAARLSSVIDQPLRILRSSNYSDCKRISRLVKFKLLGRMTMQRNYCFLLAGGLMLAGAAWSAVLGEEAPGEKLPSLLRRQPISIAESDGALVKLLKERHNTALDEVRNLHGLYL